MKLVVLSEILFIIIVIELKLTLHKKCKSNSYIFLFGLKLYAELGNRCFYS